MSSFISSVIGLVTIPGTMTGQILGGARVDDAVRYQQIIMQVFLDIIDISRIMNLCHSRFVRFMISTSCMLGTVLAVLCCALILVDECPRMRMDRLKYTKTAWSVCMDLYDWVTFNLWTCLCRRVARADTEPLLPSA